MGGKEDEMEVGGDSERGEKERKQSVKKNGKLNINGQRQKWDDSTEVLKDGKGKTRRGERQRWGNKGDGKKSFQWKGEMRGDKEGECTFTGGMGEIVINYIMESEEIRERIREVKVEDKIDSVHQPIEAVIK